MKTTKTLTIIAAIATALAAIGDYVHLIPGSYGALATAILAPLTAVLVAVGDYLDDGRVNGSFLPGRKLSEDQPKTDTNHEK